MMHDVIEIATVYFYFLLTYPLLVVVYFQAEPMVYGWWLTLGCLSLMLLYWRKYTAKWLNFCVALWFMPSKLICGSATLLPWPVAFWVYLQTSTDIHACVHASGLLLTLIFNILLIYVAVKAIGMLTAWMKSRSQRPQVK